MDRFSPTGNVSKKLVHLLRWTTFPAGILLECISPAWPVPALWIAPIVSHLDFSHLAAKFHSVYIEDYLSRM